MLIIPSNRRRQVSIPIQLCESCDKRVPSAINPSEKIFALILIYEELNTLLNRCYRLEYVREFLAQVIYLVNQGHENCMDEALEFLRTLTG